MTGTRELLEGIDPDLVASGPEQAAAKSCAAPGPRQGRRALAGMPAGRPGLGQGAEHPDFRAAFGELIEGEGPGGCR